jgi:hypothetical protein
VFKKKTDFIWGMQLNFYICDETMQKTLQSRVFSFAFAENLILENHPDFISGTITILLIKIKIMENFLFLMFFYRFASDCTHMGENLFIIHVSTIRGKTVKI